MQDQGYTMENKITVSIINGQLITGKGVLISIKKYEQLLSILNNDLITPLSITSHKSLYNLVTLALELGISKSRLAAVFKRWTIDRSWLSLSHAEYIPLLHQIHNCFVDYYAYFKNNDDLFDNLLDIDFIMSILPLDKAIKALVDIELYPYYNHINVDHYYKASYATMIAKLTINIFDLDLRFIKYQNTKKTIIYNCNSISIWPALKLNERAITTYDVFLSRFRAFTCGIFDDIEGLPWEHMMFAGGAISKLVRADYQEDFSKLSDIDIFIVDAVNDVPAFKLLYWLTNKFKGRIYYSLKNIVMNIFIEGINRYIQIINKIGNSISDILNNFDLTCVTIGYVDNKVIGLPGCIYSLMTRVNIPRTIYTKPYRVYKSMVDGFMFDSQIFASQTRYLIRFAKKMEIYKSRQNHIYYPRSDIPASINKDILTNICGNLVTTSLDDLFLSINSTHCLPVVNVCWEYICSNILPTNEYAYLYYNNNKLLLALTYTTVKNVARINSVTYNIIVDKYDNGLIICSKLRSVHIPVNNKYMLIYRAYGEYGYKKNNNLRDYIGMNVNIVFHVKIKPYRDVLFMIKNIYPV